MGPGIAFVSIVTMANLSFNFSMPNMTAPGQCFGPDGRYSTECIYRTICPQFKDYFIHTGLWVIGIYIVGGWLLWAYFAYLNDRIDWDGIYKQYPALLQLADMRTTNGKIAIDLFIRDKLSKLLLGYAVITVFMALAPF